MVLYYAKSNPKETLEKHIELVLKEYNRLKDIYPRILNETHWELLKEICIYHDMGKINTNFQNKINSVSTNQNLEEIPHGFLSPAFLPYSYYINNLDYHERELRLLVQSIYYHHHRPEKLQTEIATVIKNDLVPRYEELSMNYIRKEGLNYSEYLGLKERDKLLDTEEKMNFYLDYILLKGLLNKIDYAASGHVEVELPPENVGTKAKEFINNLPSSDGLNDMQKFMDENQHNSVVVTASTGIGKTEGALIWIGEEKGIFSLPLTTSINAMYFRLKEKMNLKHLGLLHANMLSQLLKETEDRAEEFDLTLYNKMRNFSMPLTISTIDQFVDFIFGYDGSEIKYATLSYAKLVIDEIQMYDPKLIGYLLIALSKMQKLGGKFAIITATFPPIFEYFMKQLGIAYEKPKQPFLKKNKIGKVITRHYVDTLGKTLDIDEMNKHVDLNKKNLVIMNTIKEAQELYKKAAATYEDKVHLLHSRFIKKDKNKKEKEIIDMGQLTNKSTGIWITTSLVEASVDIDFDILITELTEISGLLQRMGRVYRNRDYNGDCPNVFIYTGNPYPSGVSKKRSIVDLDLFNRSKNVLHNFGRGFLSEIEKMNLVDEVYNTEELMDSEYFEIIKKTIRDYADLIPFEVKKREIDLRAIDTQSIIPLSVYEDNRTEIEKALKTTKNSKKREEKIKAMDIINEYVVSSPNFRLQRMKETKVLELSKRTTLKVYDFPYTSEHGLSFVSRR